MPSLAASSAAVAALLLGAARLGSAATVTLNATACNASSTDNAILNFALNLVRAAARSEGRRAGRAAAVVAPLRSSCPVRRGVLPSTPRA